MNVFVTGGAGYIGSHTCVELLLAGHEVVVFDNFCNSHPETLKRIEQITGRKLHLVKGDIRDQATIETALCQYQCNAVIHFAGLKAVGESVEKPLAYYDNNVVGTHRLLMAMQNCGVDTLVFSSSATVYGEPQHLPLTERHPLSATNPYGNSKLIIEKMLNDLWRANSNWRIAILRYFNPVGAHESGLIGEDPQGIPNNLMPYIAQVAVGRREYLNVWGNDYPTSDGTGVRDYIHVVDLAKGHLKALERINSPQCTAINLGTGVGYSVLIGLILSAPICDEQGIRLDVIAWNKPIVASIDVCIPLDISREHLSIALSIKDLKDTDLIASTNHDFGRTHLTAQKRFTVSFRMMNHLVYLLVAAIENHLHRDIHYHKYFESAHYFSSLVNARLWGIFRQVIQQSVQVA